LHPCAKAARPSVAKMSPLRKCAGMGLARVADTHGFAQGEADASPLRG
jgi:hypothetical protein